MQYKMREMNAGSTWGVKQNEKKQCRDTEKGKARVHVLEHGEGER
jgi:hypothetical protein